MVCGLGFPLGGGCPELKENAVWHFGMLGGGITSPVFPSGLSEDTIICLFVFGSLGKRVFLVDEAISANASICFYLQPGFSVSAKKSRHIRMGQFPPFAREAGALATDAVADVMQIYMNFFHTCSTVCLAATLHM